MKVKLSVKKIVKSIAKQIGIKAYDQDVLKRKYNRWKDVNKKWLNVNTCIDVGVGYGTDEMYKRVSFNNLLLVEPLEVYEESISKIKKERGGKWIKLAASSQSGEQTIKMNEDKPEKSSFLKRKKKYMREGRKKAVSVKKKRVDKIVKNVGMKGSYGIKIDTEGHDMEVLKGSKSVLKSTKFVVLEVPIEKRFENSYDIEELTKYMSKKGFYIGNIVGLDVDSPVKFLDFVFFNNKYR